VYQLLRDAQVLVPAVAELELVEMTARARPATPDNAPLLGRVNVPGSAEHVAGLIIATGFFRHGVLLTPAAAVICRDLMDGTPDPRWLPFGPARFSALVSVAAQVHANAALDPEKYEHHPQRFAPRRVRWRIHHHPCQPNHRPAAGS
jgi:glycine oxidase